MKKEGVGKGRKELSEKEGSKGRRMKKEVKER